MKVFSLFTILVLLLLTSCADNADNSTDQHAQDEQHKHEAEITDFKLLEKQPRPVNMNEVMANLKYPDDALTAGAQGRVVIRLLVGTNGEYLRHRVMRSPHESLTRVVEPLLEQLKFEPGIREGEPIPVWVTVPFDFQEPKA